MTGNLNMGTHKVVNVVDPTLAQDASTEKYVDTLAATVLKKDSSVAMTGDLFVGTHKIT